MTRKIREMDTFRVSDLDELLGPERVEEATEMPDEPIVDAEALTSVLETS